MGFNFTCGNRDCFKNALNPTEWCKDWRPPPMPKELSENLKAYILNDIGFKSYRNECSSYVDIPKLSSTTSIKTSALPTQTSLQPTTDGTSKASTAATTVVTSLGPSITTTAALSTTTTTEPVPLLEEASSAGGLIAGLVILFLFLLAIVLAVIWWYLWKRKKKRSGSINSLPLKKYEDTNFLDNKARQNQCYTPSTNHHPDDKNSNSAVQSNQYGSFPLSDGKPQVAYVNVKNRNSIETKVESPVEFDKMNMSGHSEVLAKDGYDNDNFMNDLEQRGARSPGVNSQTPLFEDTIDGPALPNSVPSSKTVSDSSIHNGDKPHQNGSTMKVPFKLPPVDMTVNKRDLRNNSDSTRKTSDSSLQSPKKKKAVYLQRKSEPVKGLEDITQDMAGNRKSVA